MSYDNSWYIVRSLPHYGNFCSTSINHGDLQGIDIYIMLQQTPVVVHIYLILHLEEVSSCWWKLPGPCLAVVLLQRAPGGCAGPGPGVPVDHLHMKAASGNAKLQTTNNQISPNHTLCWPPGPGCQTPAQSPRRGTWTLPGPWSHLSLQCCRRLQGLYTGGARAVARLDADWRWDALLSTAFIYLLDLIIICNHNILTTSPCVINETYHLYDQPCPGLKFMNDNLSINSKHHRILNFLINTTLNYFYTQISTDCTVKVTHQTCRTCKSMMHLVDAVIDIT